jgi:hypothetical protein
VQGTSIQIVGVNGSYCIDAIAVTELPKSQPAFCGGLDSLFEGKGTHLGRSEREDIPGKREIGGDQIGYCRHHELQRVLAGKRSYLNSNVTKPQRMISPF